MVESKQQDVHWLMYPLLPFLSNVSLAFPRISLPRLETHVLTLRFGPGALFLHSHRLPLHYRSLRQSKLFRSRSTKHGIRLPANLQ